jgi:hypothetical protein
MKRHGQSSLPCHLPWLLPAILAAGCLLAAGCGARKGELAGKLTVEATPQLTELGVTVKDWSYVDQKFAVQLAASKDFGAPWIITLQADTGSIFSMMSPLNLKAGQSEWVEVGGFKFVGTPFQVTPNTQKVTVGVRNQLVAPR